MKVKSDYVVYQNLSPHAELHFGTKIISINGTPIGEVVEYLMPFIPADGNNKTRKYNALKRGFYRYYSYYVNSASKTFNIVYETANGETQTAVAHGISKASFDTKRKSSEKSNDPPLSFQILDNNSTAILKVSTFRSD